ncbi:MAG: beta-ketoacyl-[acyl-carrier-protein] synthase family protein [Bacteroidetes bacterium]|nr:MAG: beta-ketoacyl-[acyl-carrier-protein] synthase family protein [Bacteroidota bacterium]
MNKKVYITGIGAISAIGNNVAENFNSLKNKKSGIGKITLLNTIFKAEIPAGEVKLSDKHLIEQLRLPEKEVYTRTALLGITAVKEALKNAGISDPSKEKTGIVSATTVAGMVSSEKYYLDFLNSDLNNDFIKTHEAADSTEKIADYFGISEFMTTISTACSSSANAIIIGTRLIKNGILDRVIVGGTDALSKFTLNGFNTLMILDRKPCKPFDNGRQGLNLGEAAAYLILESEELVKKENKKPLAVISGYANANDAFHQTASSPNGYGASLAMQQALETAKLKPEEIDYINVHGTGTANNDLSEGRAMLNVFDNKIPKFSSTKAYTGHTLAAAGSLEAVFSVLSLQNKIIFPNLRFQNPMSEFHLIPETEILKNINIKHIMSNSFGFGGNGTVLIISETN